MSGQWKGSNRRAELPANWGQIREQRFRLDGYRCTETLPSGKRCPRSRASGHRLECDHMGSKFDHRLESLSTKCSHHHGKKSAQQGVEARISRRQKPARRIEEHPGTVRRTEGGEA